MYMIMFVLDNMSRLNEVLEVWEKAGIQGATIIESTGIHRIRRRLIPMRYVIPTSGSISVEEGNYSLFVIVTSAEMVQACLQATEQIVGNLDQPHTGVFAAWPLTVLKGVPGELEAGE